VLSNRAVGKVGKDRVKGSFVRTAVVHLVSSVGLGFLVTLAPSSTSSSPASPASSSSPTSSVVLLILRPCSVVIRLARLGWSDAGAAGLVLVGTEVRGMVRGSAVVTFAEGEAPRDTEGDNKRGGSEDGQPFSVEA